MSRDLATLLLHAPQDFTNLCVIARTLESFGHRRCYVFDPFHLVRERYGKSYRQRLRTQSAGAFLHIEWQRVEDPPSFLAHYEGRKLAAVPTTTATSLFELHFVPGDLVVLGSEAAGLPDAVIAACDHGVTIPTSGTTKSLNLSVAASLFVAEAARQAASHLAANPGSSALLR